MVALLRDRCEMQTKKVALPPCVGGERKGRTVQEKGGGTWNRPNLAIVYQKASAASLTFCLRFSAAFLRASLLRYCACRLGFADNITQWNFGAHTAS